MVSRMLFLGLIAAQLTLFVPVDDVIHSLSSTPPNVVFVTLDGVRWQEVFHGVDPQRSDDRAPIFPHFLGVLSKEGPVWGNPLNAYMQVSNASVLSLPAYLSIMSGMEQPSCNNNGCSRISVETFQERILRELGLPKKAVATIASWKGISLASEHLPGSTFVNAGVDPLDDGTMDPELIDINLQQRDSFMPFCGDCRYDKFTFAHAIRYLKVHRPRFLYISLNDADYFAHATFYTNYVTTLRNYDDQIRQLVETIDGLGEYGENTTLILTTDHGRGDGNGWTSHNADLPESRDVWMFIRNRFTRGQMAPVGSQLTHLDLRPTIEHLMGLQPITGPGKGAVIPGLWPEPQPVFERIRVGLGNARTSLRQYFRNL